MEKSVNFNQVSFSGISLISTKIHPETNITMYAGQEATVRMGHRTIDWFQIGKRICQGCLFSLCLFNLYAEYIMRNTGVDEAQAESRFLGEISITSDMQMTLSLRQKVKKN